MSRHLSPTMDMPGGSSLQASSPTFNHRYEKQAYSSSPSAQGVSSSRSPMQGSAAPSTASREGRGSQGAQQFDPSSPYGVGRSPTQLRYGNDQVPAVLEPPSPHVYSPPPPFRPAASSPQPTMQQTAHSPHRGNNVFDQDIPVELTGPPRQPVPSSSYTPRSASAVMARNYPSQGLYAAPPSAHAQQQLPSRYQPAYQFQQQAYPQNQRAPAAYTQYQRPASTTVLPTRKGGYDAPRVQLYADCGNMVDERDESGAIRTTYRCGSLLGSGGFAKVFDFLDIRTLEHFACKVIEKSKLSDDIKRRKFFIEINVHRRMQHPNIVRFIRHFQDEYYHYILLERCCRFSLMDMSRQRRVFTVPEAQYIMLQLIQAADYMHSNRVIHRDLKLGNIMIDSTGCMKIGDFGFAAELSTFDEKKKTMCGTPNYIAPEILSVSTTGGYGFEVDVWCLGVILYTLVVGTPPFETNAVNTTYQKIKRGDYTFPSSARVSDSCADLIRWILQKDPKMRPQLIQIRNHSFFRSPEAPRSAPAAFLGLDPELNPVCRASSPYAEAGRSSSPIQESAVNDGGASPVLQPEVRTGVPAEFTPPPQFHGPQPTPYHFSASPQPQTQSPSTGSSVPHHLMASSPQERLTRDTYVAPERVVRPLTYIDAAEGVEGNPLLPVRAQLPPARPLPNRVVSNHLLVPVAAAPLSMPPQRSQQPSLPQVQSPPSSSSESSSSNDSSSVSHDDSAMQVVTTSDEDAVAVPKLPPPPRAYFTDIVHFSRYGYGFLVLDQRGVAGPRTVSVGAFLNDKSKLVRDVSDDQVWYFARVRGDSPPQPTAQSDFPLLSADLAPRCFYDQLHLFARGHEVLDPKSPKYTPLSDELQRQNVFKKYTIVKFMETHFSNRVAGKEDSPMLTAAVKNFYLEPLQDIFGNKPLTVSSTMDGDCDSSTCQITFVKEAEVLLLDSILPPGHHALESLVNAPSHRLPRVASTRFSDSSFQVSVSAPCPAPLAITPQVVGIKGTTAVSIWKVDFVIYDTNRLYLVYRADDDVYAISVEDVQLQKGRGYCGTRFSPTGKFPSQLTGIFLPSVLMSIIVDMLRRVHCPQVLLDAIQIA